MNTHMMAAMCACDAQAPTTKVQTTGSFETITAGPEMPEEVRKLWQETWQSFGEAMELHRRNQERCINLLLSPKPAAKPAAAPDIFGHLAPPPGLPPSAASPAQPKEASDSSLKQVVADNLLPSEDQPETPIRESATAAEERQTWEEEELVVEVKERLTEIKSKNGGAGRLVEAHALRAFRWWLELEVPEPQGLLARFIHTTYWQVLVASVIAANAVFMVPAADVQMRLAVGAYMPIEYRVLEGCFVAFFVVELCVRLLVHGRYFFCNFDWRWNWFDLLLVLQSVIDVAIENLASADPAGNGSVANLTFLRTLRALRFVRTLRAIRVLEFAAGLRRIIASVVRSVSSLFWCFAMMAFVFYIFSLMVMQAAMTGMAASDFDEAKREDVVTHFGSVSRSMMSFYMATSGGNDWSMYYDALVDVAWEAAALFLFSIAYMQIAMLNILTGMFVETAMKAAMPDHEAQALEQRREEFRQAHEVDNLIRELDRDGSGKISREEFLRITSDGRMHAAFDILGLSIRDADMFYEMLRKTCQVKEIDKDFLVGACLKMKGPASSIEQQMLAYRMYRMQGQLDHIERAIAKVSWM